MAAEANAHPGASRLYRTTLMIMMGCDAGG